MCDPSPPPPVRVTCPVPRPQVLSPVQPRALASQHTLRNPDIISQVSTLTVALRALGLIGEWSLRPRNRGTGLGWLLPAFALIPLSFPNPSPHGWSINTGLRRSRGSQETAPQSTCTRISDDVITWLASFKSRSLRVNRGLSWGQQTGTSWGMREEEGEER